MDIILELVFLLGILILGLILRYIPHIRFQFPSTPDTFFMLNRFVDPEYQKKDVTYPKFFHQFMRFIFRSPETLSGRTLNRITPIFDLTTTVILFLFCRMTFGIESALVITLLFSITPFIVKQGITLSSRPFGLFLFTCSLLILALPYPFNWFAIIPISLTLLTHRLSSQTLFFIVLALSFFDLQAGVIFVVGLGFAALISRGYYFKILRNHVKFVIRYIKGEHYPNQRFRGLLLVPTFVGFLFFMLLRGMQLIYPFPLILFGVLLNPSIIIAPYFENLILIWGIVCILLLILWIAGESYKHMYLAGTPFAVATVLVLQNSFFFVLLLILLIVGSLSLSLYFTLRFQHLPKDLITILQELKTIEEPVCFLISQGLLRAGEYFSQKRGKKVIYSMYSPEEFANLINQEGITHVILLSKHLSLTDKYQTLLQVGEWFLIKVTPV